MKKMYKVWTIIEKIDIDENGVEVTCCADVPDEVSRCATYEDALSIQDKIQTEFGNIVE